MRAWLLQDWITSHKKRGIQPVISNPSRQVMHLLEKAGIPELIGEEYITVRVNDAVLMCQVSTLPFPTLVRDQAAQVLVACRCSPRDCVLAMRVPH